MDVSHADFKIPSEHTICGKRYVGEFSIYFIHPIRKQRLVLSIMIDLYPSDSEKMNRHFQKLINKWQEVFDENHLNCVNNRNKGRKHVRRMEKKEALTNATSPIMRELSHQRYNVSNYYVYGKKVSKSSKPWSPFHRDIVRTHYFYAYWGSLTEPPCSDEVTYRVLLEPMLISVEQLDQLRSILFDQVDNQCRRTSVHYNGSVARPLQEQQNRPVWKCTSVNFRSDLQRDNEST